MSDTPRTDAAEQPIDRVDTIKSRPCSVVLSDFARDLERECAKLREELSLLQERRARELAAISVCALSNTSQSAKEQRISREHELWTPAYGDVCQVVDDENKLREELKAANKDADLLSFALYKLKDGDDWNEAQDIALAAHHARIAKNKP